MVKHSTRKRSITITAILVIAAISIFVFIREDRNFGGLALQAKTWEWMRTLQNDDTIIVPNTPKTFRLAFDDGGHISGTTDCNTFTGMYSYHDDIIAISNITSTEKHCDASQENVFLKTLSSVHTFHYNQAGELILSLQYGEGSIIFR